MPRQTGLEEDYGWMVVSVYSNSVSKTIKDVVGLVYDWQVLV